MTTKPGNGRSGLKAFIINNKNTNKDTKNFLTIPPTKKSQAPIKSNTAFY
jgi:hypothetical protein